MTGDLDKHCFDEVAGKVAREEELKTNRATSFKESHWKREWTLGEIPGKGCCWQSSLKFTFCNGYYYMFNADGIHPGEKYTLMMQE